MKDKFEEEAEKIINSASNEYGFRHKNKGDKTKTKCLIEHIALALKRVAKEEFERGVEESAVEIMKWWTAEDDTRRPDKVVRSIKQGGE